jgi:hypothetical protein
MWFRVAVEWKYALHWFRSSTKRSMIEEDVPYQSFWIWGPLIRGKAYSRIRRRVHSVRAQLHYPLTLSPLEIVGLQREEDGGIAEKCLPEDHDVMISNLFSCTTPWLSILTGNPSDADLSRVSARRLII